MKLYFLELLIKTTKNTFAVEVMASIHNFNKSLMEMKFIVVIDVAANDTHIFTNTFHDDGDDVFLHFYFHTISKANFDGDDNDPDYIPTTALYLLKR